MSGFYDLDQLRQQGLFCEWRYWLAFTALRCFEDCCDDSFRIAMTREKELALLRSDVCDVTRLGTDVKNRRANGQNVVDLARVNNADKFVSHDDYVQIRRGQRTGKLVSGW